MSTFESYISGDRECDQCGYNLHGLPENGKCPECGTSIRRRTRRTSGTMSEEAPTRFVRRLYYGFLLASLGTVGSVFFSLFGLMVLASPLWVAGIWLITTERPNRGTIVPDKVLDNDQIRLTVRLVSIAWVIYGLSIYAIIMVTSRAVGAPSPGMMIPLSITHFVFGAIAWLGLIPTCIYFAELAYWASHDHIAERLRSSAWAMAVFGVFSVVLTAIVKLNIAPSAAAGFIRIFTMMIVVFAVVIFFFTIIQLISVMKWVIKHQSLAVGSADRVRERIERDINAHGTITTGLICRSCGYDLDGLPFGGACPECGESYADITPMPILDPATMHTDRDESVIEIIEGDNKGIYFNTELDAEGKPKPGGVAYTPSMDIPDDGDIPLADEDENTQHDDEDGNLLS
jgi:hypothetical protein